MDITVVLVTFNRLDCLKIALSKFEEQTLQAKRIIVVNNCSTDGTEEFLADWSKSPDSIFQKIVIKTEKNIGGAGGFYTGLNEAIKYTDTDWIWLSDDDAYPEVDAFEQLELGYNKLDSQEETSVLFSSVVNKSRFDLSHRRLVKKTIKGVKFINIEENEYRKDKFEVHQGSYVGMLVKVSSLLKTGLTNKDFFIYYDDTEHTERLRKIGKMYCIPTSRINHDVNVDNQISWKNYYGFRNSLILINDIYGKQFALIEALKRIILFVSPINKKIEKPYKDMLFQGIKDGLKSKTGIHEKYKPGWKP